MSTIHESPYVSVCVGACIIQNDPSGCQVLTFLTNPFVCYWFSSISVLGLCLRSRPGSSFGIATTCWTFRGSNPSGGEIFLNLSRPAQPASCTMGTGSFPWVENGRRRDADPSPPSSSVIIKGQSYTSTPPTGRMACTEPQCLYKGDLYLYL